MNGSPSDNGNGTPTALLRHQQARMLRLVTQSFCAELVRFGVDKSDLIGVSVHLLDYVTDGAAAPPGDGVPFPEAEPDGKTDVPAWPFNLDDVEEGEGDRLRYRETAIGPLGEGDVEAVGRWIQSEPLRQTMIGLLPRTSDGLRRHLLGTSGNAYFGIYAGDVLVGAIGGEGFDEGARKVEMRKFIGEAAYRGRGIGTEATFLWLHHAFGVQGANKVYLHTLDANLRNINLNARLGFELEGVLYEDVCLEGRCRDVVRMSLLRSRWKELTEEGA